MIDYRLIPREELQQHLICHQRNIHLLARRRYRQDAATRQRGTGTQFNLLNQILEIKALLESQEATA